MNTELHHNQEHCITIATHNTAHTQGERPTPTTKHLRSPGNVPDETRTMKRQGNKPEKSYIELTPGTPVWVHHRQNTTWEPATVVS